MLRAMKCLLIRSGFSSWTWMEQKCPLSLSVGVPCDLDSVSPLGWMQLHVGVVLRKGRSKEVAVKHSSQWVWFDGLDAARKMYNARQPGTTVLWLTTWARLHKKGGEMLIGVPTQELFKSARWHVYPGPSRHDLSEWNSGGAGFRWHISSADFQHRSILDMLMEYPGVDQVRRLHHAKTSWKHDANDPRSWRSVKLSDLAGP
jgi:hypothetical protein